MTKSSNISAVTFSVSRLPTTVSSRIARWPGHSSAIVTISTQQLRHATLSGIEFLHRFLQHVLPRRLHQSPLLRHLQPPLSAPTESSALLPPYGRCSCWLHNCRREPRSSPFPTMSSLPDWKIAPPRHPSAATEATSMTNCLAFPSHLPFPSAFSERARRPLSSTSFPSRKNLPQSPPPSLHKVNGPDNPSCPGRTSALNLD